jgi:hypothetical protein
MYVQLPYMDATAAAHNTHTQVSAVGYLGGGICT